ncbi:MAG TPA: hypothetical protein VE621_01570 [Bryobacteraceae bacterium]|nr:hypothetical protein [Bryobacteraceae bacterium]
MTPDLAYVLAMLGIVLVAVEFLRPGLYLPGIGGATLFLIALSRLSELRLQLDGVMLVVAAVLLHLLNAYGWTWAGPLATLFFVLGSMRLTAAPALHPATCLIAGGLTSGIIVWLGAIASRARRNKSVEQWHNGINRTGIRYGQKRRGRV